MTPAASVVLHGHFYQPPRENPWLDMVETEPSAAPYHDWNRRVEQECYRAVAAARVPGAGGRIARIVNTLAWISFDFGPTLLEWLEREAPRTYGAVLEADAESRRRTGHGNAIAAPYHHIILPLATRRDKVTEVRWGIADFRRRFRREPEGLWLPETAVDDETLDVLAQEGIAFTVLGPHQVTRPSPAGLPLRYRTRGGRDIALCVYDGPLSHDVAFGELLEDAFVWARRLLGTGDRAAPVRLASLAVDGETFGHHHRFGEMALARVLEILREPAAGAEPAAVTNYAAFLAAHPPGQAAGLVAPTSWSCAHGVERWRSDCGCKAAPERGWQQRWRAPLRAAMDWLAGELHAVYEREAGALLDDPWAVRDAYGGALGPDPAAPAALVAAHAKRPLSPAASVRARELLLMEFDALALFTSCAWFFDDIGGLEALQVLRYAAHAIELSGDRDRLEPGFSGRLAAAPSNEAAVGDGQRAYLERARPAAPPAARVAASWAARRAFAPGAPDGPVCGYDATGDAGRVRLVHRRTGGASDFETGVEGKDGWRFTAWARAPGDGPGAAARFASDALTERERDAVREALLAGIAERALSPEDRRALCEGETTLGDAAERSLVARVAALAADRSDAACAAALDLLDVLELAGRTVPFDAQTLFHEVRAGLPEAEARRLAPLGERLGFVIEA